MPRGISVAVIHLLVVAKLHRHPVLFCLESPLSLSEHKFAFVSLVLRCSLGVDLVFWSTEQELAPPAGSHCHLLCFCLCRLGSGLL